MASFNRVILMGNLTRDVEVRYLQSGMAVTDIGIAVNDRRKNQSGEWVEEVTFVDVTLWAHRISHLIGERYVLATIGKPDRLHLIHAAYAQSALDRIGR